MVYRDQNPGGRCGLCGAELEPQGAERYATLFLCRPCFDGDFGDRIAHRGLRIQQLVLVTRQMDEQRTPRTYTLVNGTVPHAIALDASFGREDLFTRIGKLFRPELKVGDPLFDDHVFIRTNDPEALGRLLRTESLQAVIHTAVSELAEHELPVVLEGPHVRLRSQQKPSASGDDYLRRVVALLLHHLAQDAERQGVARTDAEPLLDLEQECSRLIPGEKLIGLHLRFDRCDDLERLMRLERDGGHDRLERISLADLRLSSSDLTPLASISGLVALSLVRLADRVDLSGLAGALALRRLDLDGCAVSDLAPLAGLSALEELSLRDTAVGDLEPLLQLRALRRLDVGGSRVPAQQLERLRAAIPDLEIDPH